MKINDTINLSDPKKTIARRGGYNYQNKVAVLRLIDVLSKRVQKVVLEKASTQDGKNDIFDDIKAYSSTSIHHFQVKWNISPTTELKLVEFTRIDSKINIKALFESWKTYRKLEPLIYHYVHIYTTRKIASGDKLWNYLHKSLNKYPEIENSNSVFSFDSSLLKENDLPKDLRDDPEFLTFLDSLFIETEQPTSKIGNSESLPCIEDLAYDRILSILGLSKPPENKRVEDVYNNLIEICEDPINFMKDITRSFLINKLDISKNYYSVSQDIKYDSHKFVPILKYLKRLFKLVKKGSGKLISLIGLPGAGKSWLLTNLKIQYEKLYRIKPILYYCHTGIVGDQNAEKRITLQQLIQNMVNQILIDYSIINSRNTEDIYAADKPKLLKLLDELGSFAMSRGIIIPIIIDGLDHISRTSSYLGLNIKENDDIIKFLEDIKIPKGLCIIMGSQPVHEIEKIKPQVIRIKGFSKCETHEYLKRNLFSSISKESSSKIYAKTTGLPLLVAYFVKSVIYKNTPSENEIKKIIESFPVTSGDVETYYGWLWSSISDPLVKQYARILSLLRFSITKKHLKDLLPLYETGFVPSNLLIRPLVPVLKLQETRIEIFHESFKKFILRDETFTLAIKNTYNKRIFEYFKDLLFYNDDTFQYILHHGYRAELYRDVLEIVSLKFVDSALSNLFSFDIIIRNIELAIQCALKLNEVGSVSRCCLLYKYTRERIYDNLDLKVMVKTGLALGKKQIVKRIISNGNLRYAEKESIIDILACCILERIKLPYKKIFYTEFSSLEFNFTNTKSPENFGIVLKTILGISKVTKKVETSNLHDNESSSIYNAICSTCSSSELGYLKNRLGNKVLLVEKLVTKYPSTAKKLIQDSLEKNEFNYKFYEAFLRNNLECETIKKFEIFIPPFSKDLFSYNFENLHRLRKSVQLLAYCDRKNDLEYVFNKIKEYPLSPFSVLVEFIFFTSLVVGKSNKTEISPKDLLNLLTSLETFVMHRFDPNTTGGYIGYFFDDNLRKLSKDIVERATRIYILHKKDRDSVNRLLRIIKYFSEFYTGLSKFAGYMIVHENVTGELSKSALKLACSSIEATTASHLSKSYLELAGLLAVSKNMQLANSYYEKGVLATHGYGYHKDFWLLELLEISKNLNRMDQVRSLKRCYQLVLLAEYLKEVTDNDEMDIIIDRIIEEITYLDPVASIDIIKKYGLSFLRNKDIFYIVVNSVVQRLKNSPPLLRYELSQKLYFTRRDWKVSQILEHRLQLLSEIFSEDESKAKKVIEEIREFISDYLDVNVHSSDYLRSIKSKFNSLAKKLGVGNLQINPKDRKIITRNSKVTVRNCTNLDEYIQYFRKADFNVDFQQEKLITNKMNLFVKNNINNFSLSDLNKLINFILSAGRRYISRFDFVEKIALKLIRMKPDSSSKVLKVFEEINGWSSLDVLGILVKPKLLLSVISNNPQSMKLILESYTRRFPYLQGQTKVLGELLSQTGQNLLLQELYLTSYDFSKTLFRFCDIDPTKYEWLNEWKVENRDHTQVISELLELSNSPY